MRVPSWFFAAGLFLWPGAALSFSETATAAGGMTDHQARLEQLEGRISELEAQIVVAQEKVDVLKDTVLAGVVSKARGRISHVNDMGNAFTLVRATYLLDGGVIFDKEDVDGSIAGQKEIVLFDGPITPGPHKLDVALVFRVGSLGVFTYVEGYKFKVESRYTMKVVDGRTNILRVVSYDKGQSDVTKETSDRIGVRYDFEAKLASDIAPKRTPEEEAADPAEDGADATTPAD